VFTRTLHWSLSWVRSIQSIIPYCIYVTSILIVSSHLRLCLSTDSFLLDFPSNASVHSSFPHACYMPTAPCLHGDLSIISSSVSTCRQQTGPVRQRICYNGKPHVLMFRTVCDKWWWETGRLPTGGTHVCFRNSWPQLSFIYPASCSHPNATDFNPSVSQVSGLTWRCCTLGGWSVGWKCVSSP
jgi:hypothetical protein